MGRKIVSFEVLDSDQDIAQLFAESPMTKSRLIRVALRAYMGQEPASLVVQGSVKVNPVATEDLDDLLDGALDSFGF